MIIHKAHGRTSLALIEFGFIGLRPNQDEEWLQKMVGDQFYLKWYFNLENVLLVTDHIHEWANLILLKK